MRFPEIRCPDCIRDMLNQWDIDRLREHDGSYDMGNGAGRGGGAYQMRNWGYELERDNNGRGVGNGSFIEFKRKEPHWTGVGTGCIPGSSQDAMALPFAESPPGDSE